MMAIKRSVPVFLFTVLWATSTFAQMSLLNTNLDEINHHQEAAAAVLILGDHTILEKGDFSVSGDVSLSSWGSDSLYGAWGLSLQSKPGQSLGVGLSYGITDAQLRTRTLLANIQYSPPTGSRQWLQFQGAVGYQFLDSSESGNVLFFEFDDPWPIQAGNPEILLDDMDWFHGYVNVLAAPGYWVLRPQAGLGYVFSRYSWSGWEVAGFGGLDAPLGPVLSGTGSAETVTFSLGLGLELGSVRPFVGLLTFSGGAVLTARLSVLF